MITAATLEVRQTNLIEKINKKPGEGRYLTPWAAYSSKEISMNLRYSSLDEPEKRKIRARLLALQCGRCKICRKELNKAAPANLDHDHETGAIRAVLCRGCNMGLGFFLDSPLLLEHAIEYLNYHSSLATKPRSQ